MVVYFFTGIFLPAISDFIIGFSFSLDFSSQTLCDHYIVMSADRLEEHSRIFRIQSRKT
jgi:hypothetical protein